jgi:hypothetical protein
VTGLSGTVVLAQGTDTVSVSSNTTFTFSTALSSGTAYSVTVKTQPATQTCAVGNGSGSVGAANITNVAVSCTDNTYKLSGSISGLLGPGLTLVNGNDTLTIAATDSSFTFPTQLKSGTSFSISVQSQPFQPAQVCNVDNGAGTVQSSDVTSILVACTPVHGQWIWRGGSNTRLASGVYGKQGQPGAGNIPGARYGAVGWTDSTGKLWLYGGFIGNSAGTDVDGNDLWAFDPATQQWTWQGGSSIPGQATAGLYGTQGAPAADNQPGARENALAWVDGNNTLWLFGGDGYDAQNARGVLNDLWKYNPSTKQWTWMSGSNSINATGSYGTRGVAAASNVPSARSNAIGWIDGAGDLWLFGGAGHFTGNLNAPNFLNDLWVYSQSSGQWTWATGSNAGDAPGVYGTLGTASTGNTPGARWGATAWYESSTSTLWLFSGVGHDSTGAQGDLNDVWSYGNGGWTWQSGSNQQGAAGSYLQSPYGPAARRLANGWTDAQGVFWVFGGETNPLVNPLEFQDYWFFNALGSGGGGSANTWSWPTGAPTPTPAKNGSGVYGSLGTAASGNVPGAREAAVTWTDAQGNQWLFGGQGYDSAGNFGALNDLWEYVP